jgi:hypothetical protein
MQIGALPFFGVQKQGRLSDIPPPKACLRQKLSVFVRRASG